MFLAFFSSFTLPGNWDIGQAELSYCGGCCCACGRTACELQRLPQPPLPELHRNIYFF